MLRFKIFKYMLFKASQTFFLLLHPPLSLGFILLLRSFVICVAITESLQCMCWALVLGCRWCRLLQNRWKSQGIYYWIRKCIHTISSLPSWRVREKNKQKFKIILSLTGTAQSVHFAMCTLLHILLLLFLANFLLAPVLVLHYQTFNY